MTVWDAVAEQPVASLTVTGGKVTGDPPAFGAMAEQIGAGRLEGWTNGYLLITSRPVAWGVAAAGWRETLHPRDRHGRFAHKQGIPGTPGPGGPPREGGRVSPDAELGNRLAGLFRRGRYDNVRQPLADAVRAYHDGRAGAAQNLLDQARLHAQQNGQMPLANDIARLRQDLGAKHGQERRLPTLPWGSPRLKADPKLRGRIAGFYDAAAAVLVKDHLRRVLDAYDHDDPAEAAHWVRVAAAQAEANGHHLQARDLDDLAGKIETRHGLIGEPGLRTPTPGPVVGHISEGKGRWTFDRTPKVGDQVEDAYGYRGRVEGVSKGGKWAAVQFDRTAPGQDRTGAEGQNRRQIINTETGDDWDLWYADAEDANHARAWRAVVEEGRVPGRMPAGNGLAEPARPAQSHPRGQPGVGRIEDGRWQWSSPPQTGDQVQDEHGGWGVVEGVSDDHGWAAIEFDNGQPAPVGLHRRMLVDLADGSILKQWNRGAETRGEGRDWIRVVSGGVPLGILAPGEPAAVPEGVDRQPRAGEAIGGGRFVFHDHAPRPGDRVADNWGAGGRVLKVTRDKHWVAVEYDDGRHQILHMQGPDLMSGRISDSWFPHDETPSRAQRWADLMRGEMRESRLWGTPVPGGKPSHEQEVRTSLDKGIKADQEQDSKPGDDCVVEQPEGYNYFGNTADTTIVDFADGSKWVRKRGIPKRAMDAEVAYSRVAGAIGAPAPVALERDDPETGKPALWMEYVDAPIGFEWTGGQDPETEEYDPDLAEHDPDEAYNSPEGHLIGLADMICGTSDRHLGNWLVKTEDGRDIPVAIDNESSDFPGYLIQSSPFASSLDLSQLGADYSPGDWDRWQAALQGLRAEFTAMNREDWWNLLMEAFNAARSEAGNP